MNKRIITTLFLCLLLPLVAIAGTKPDVNEIPATQIINNSLPNIFRPIGDFFKRILGKKKVDSTCDLPASVATLELNKTEVFTCSSGLQDKNVCISNSPLVEVKAVAIELDKFTYIYDYTITGGKIVGKGAKVTWDLSGVKPGTYRITAAVSDGRGFYGAPKTQFVTVKECADCSAENNPK